MLRHASSGDSAGQKLRLAFVTGGDLLMWGGGEKYAVEMANALPSFSVDLFSIVDQSRRRMSLAEVDALAGHNLIYFEVVRPLGGGLSLPLTASSLKAILKLREFDVVYCANNSLLAFLIPWSKITRRKLVFGVHDPSFLDGLGSRAAGTAAHHSRPRLGRLIRALLLQLTPCIRVQNAEDYNVVRAIRGEHCLHLIPDSRISVGSGPSNAPEMGFTVLFVGRLAIHQKGIDLLCEIAARVIERHPDIRFRIVGSGEDGEKLVRDLARRYPANIDWLGFLSETRLRGEYQSASMLVCPSRDETLGLTVLEALSYGLRVVAFSNRGSREIVTSSAHGRLITEYKVEPFVDAIVELYHLWKGDRSGYLGGRDSIIDAIEVRFSRERVVADLERMLLPSPSPSPD